MTGKTDPIRRQTGKKRQTAARGRRRFALALGLGLAVFALVMLTSLAGAAASGIATPWRVGLGVASALLWLGFYRQMRLRQSGHPPRDLRRARLLPDSLIGGAIGAGLFALVVLALAVFARVSFTGPQAALPVLAWLAASAATGVFEEVIARGIILREIEKRRGSLPALVLSSLIFAALHVANSGFSPIAALGVLAAGTLLGAAYLWRRSLWLPIALHAAWNFAEGGIFGFAVSGQDPGGALFSVSIEGPALLTGGAFGPEAALPALVILSLAALVLVSLARRAGQFRPRPTGQC